MIYGVKEHKDMLIPIPETTIDKPAAKMLPAVLNILGKRRPVENSLRKRRSNM